MTALEQKKLISLPGYNKVSTGISLRGDLWKVSENWTSVPEGMRLPLVSSVVIRRMDLPTHVGEFDVLVAEFRQEIQEVAFKDIKGIRTRVEKTRMGVKEKVELLELVDRMKFKLKVYRKPVHEAITYAPRLVTWECTYR